MYYSETKGQIIFNMFFQILNRSLVMNSEIENNFDRLLRPKSAATYLDIGLSTFWLWVKQEKIKVIKLSSKVTVVKERELIRFINEAV